MSTSTVHPPVEELSTSTAPALRMSLGSQKLFTVIAIFAMVIGAGAFLGGIAGAVYTWDQAAAQDITTPDDARIAEAPVRGPLTMWSQSDIITHHQLDSTDGLYYSQMEREVPAVDEAGNPVVDENGEPVMVPNEARASWITATTLTTALGLGILSYAVSAFAMVVGLTLLALGWVVLRLRRATVALH
jgi:hypothetical protein